MKSAETGQTTRIVVVYKYTPFQLSFPSSLHNDLQILTPVLKGTRRNVMERAGSPIKIQIKI
jgi:hypothetical protein